MGIKDGGFIPFLCVTMIRTDYKYFILVISLCVFGSCVNSKKIHGEYKQIDRNTPCIIHLDSDGTGYYTWWTDIRMKNNGTWTVSNDTIKFIDTSSFRPEDRIFIIKRNKLIDQKGRIYKKMNFFQRRLVYRGR